MRIISVYVLVSVIRSLAGQNFNTDTRLAYFHNIVLLPNGGWLEVVELLKQVDSKQTVADLIKNQEELFVDNTRLAHRLVTSVFRRSMCSLMEFQLRIKTLEIIEMAAKMKLGRFLDRLSFYDTESYIGVEHNRESLSTKIIDSFLTPRVLEIIKTNEHLSSQIDELEEEKFSYLKDVAEEIIVNKELEYIDLATSDPRISRALFKIYSMMKGREVTNIAEKIVDIKTIDKYDQRSLGGYQTRKVIVGESGLLNKPDFGVLKILFHNEEIYEIIKSYEEYFKNQETSITLQFMVVRHCKLYYSVKKLKSIEGALEVLGKAQELKMEDVKERIEKMIAGTYSPLSDTTVGNIPQTGIDLRNVIIFSSLWHDKTFSELENDQISKIENALSMWIDEKVQLAIVKPVFDKFFRETFDIIDRGTVDNSVKELVRNVEFIQNT